MDLDQAGRYGTESVGRAVASDAVGLPVTGQGHTGNSARGRYPLSVPAATADGARQSFPGEPRSRKNPAAHDRCQRSPARGRHTPWRRVQFLAGLPALTVLAFLLLAPAAGWAQDLPVVSVFANQASVPEGGTATFRLARTGSTAATLTVSVRETERPHGTSVGGSTVDREYTFAANSSEMTISVVSTQNNWAAATTPTPYMYVFVNTGNHYQIGTNNALTTIIDDDPLMVDIAPVAATVAEGDGYAEFIVRRVAVDTVTGRLTTYAGRSVTLTVGVTQTGAVIDGAPADVEVTLARTDTEKTIQVALADDTVTEADGSVTLTLPDSEAFAVHGSHSATVTVIDDELPFVSVSANEESVPEGGTATFRLHREGSTAAPLTVTVSEVEYPWGADDDGSRVDRDYTFTAGSSDITIALRSSQNNFATADHGPRPPWKFAPLLLVYVRAGTGYEGAWSEASTKIIDDDLVQVDIAPVAATVREGDGYAEFIVRRVYVRSTDGELLEYRGRPVTLTVGVTQTGAVIDGEPAAVEVTLARTDRRQTIRVPLADDAEVEADGSVTLTLPDSEEFGVHGSSSATVTVTDDDAEVTIAPKDVSQPEGVIPSFVLRRTGYVGGELQVTVDVTEIDRYRVIEGRYTVTFAPGSPRADLLVWNENDYQDEDDGPITATIVAGHNYMIGTPGTATLTVIDDDPSPVLTIAGVRHAEGDGALELEVALSFATGRSTVRTVTASYATADGTATAGADYTAAGGTLTFVPTEENGWRPPAQTISVSIHDDALHEGDETFAVTLSDAVYAELPASPATVTIADDDLPVVRLEPLAAEVAESAGAVFTLTRTRTTSVTALEVDVAVTSEGDFLDGTPPTAVTFDAMSATATLTVPLHDDSVAEYNGAVIATISANDDVYAIDPAAGAARVEVRDNEKPLVTMVTYTFGGSPPHEVTEGDDLEFTMKRVGNTVDAYTLPLQWGVRIDDPSLATERSAYISAPPPLSATFPPGEATVALSLRTDDDDVDEPDMEIGVFIPYPAADADYQHDWRRDEVWFTVRDDDLPRVTITPAGTPVAESGEAVFNLARTSDTGRMQVQVDVTEVGAFLASPGSTTAIFASGSLTTTLTVPLNDDDLHEDEGSVTATIAAGSGYRAGDPAAVTVTDDDLDQQVQISAQAATVTEGDDAVFVLNRWTVTGVSISQDTTRAALTVNVQATGEGDFLDGTLPTSVTFDAGAVTTMLRVPTSDDMQLEASGSVTVQLLPGDGYRLSTNAEHQRATVAVADDEGGPEVSISPNAAQVNEGQDVVFTLTRTLDTASSLRVLVGLGGHTKMATTETLERLGNREWAEFDAGAASTTLTLTTQDDEINEGDGELYVEIKRYLTYRIMGNARTEVLIKDDDVPVVTAEYSERDIIEGTPLGFSVVRTGYTSTFLEVYFRSDKRFNHPYFPGRDGNTDGLSNPPFFVFDVGQSTNDLWYSSNGWYVYVGPAGGEVRYEIRPYRCRGEPCFTPRYTVGEPSSTTIRIANRFPTLLASAVAESVDEGEPAVFTLERVWNQDNLAGETTIVVFAVTEEGDVIDGVTPTTVTFGPGETHKTLSIPTQEDSVHGTGGGSVTLQLGGADKPESETIESAYVIYTQETADGRHLSRATVTVLDDDPNASSVTITANAESVTEGEDAGFTLTRTQTSGELKVRVERRLEGHEDYYGATALTVSELTRTLPDGQATDSFTVDTVDGTTVRPDGKVVAKILSPAAGDPAYMIGDPGTAEVAVRDDDAARISIAAVSETVEEGQDVVFTLARAGATTNALEVTVNVTDPGGVASGTLPASVQFAANSGTTALTIATTDDETVQLNRVVTATLAVRDPLTYLLGEPSSAAVTVGDDDAPVVTIVVNRPVVEEGREYKWTVTRTGYTPRTFRVPIRLTITTGEDIHVEDIRTGNFGAGGESEQRVQENLTPPKDGVPQPDRVWHLELLPSDDGAYRLGDPYIGTFTVIDGDRREELSLARTSPPTFREAGQVLQFGYTVTNSGNVPTAAPVKVSDDVAGEVVCSAESLAPEAAAGCQLAYTVTAADVTAGEIVSTAEATDGTTRSSSVSETISLVALPSLSIAGAGAHEQHDYELAFTVTLEGTRSGEVSIDYATADGTATAGADYVAATGSLTFGSEESQQVIRVDLPDDDNLAEGDETFTVTLSNPSNATLATAQATGTITDSDVLEVSVAAEAVTVQEGQDAVFTVAVAGATSTADVAVGYSVSGTATAGEDYTAPSGTLTIPAGAASGTITIGTLADEVADPNETVIVVPEEVSTTGTATVSGLATTTIKNAGQPGVTVSPTSLTVGEGGSRTYTVVLDSEPTAAVTVSVRVPQGTDVSVDTTSLTFTTGDWSTVQTVTVRAAQDDDAVVDDAATIGHTVSSTGDYDGEIVSDVAVTITDDDRRGVTVSPTSLTVEEGDDNTYTVVLDSKPTAAVTVTVNVPSGTDVSASPTSLTFTADDWSTARTVTVSAAQDDDALMDDAVTVGHTVGSTGDYSGETAADVAVMITETDTPTLSIADVSAPESARSMTFTVSSSVASSRTVTVGWATGNATATAGEDYTAVTAGRVTFSPAGTLRQAISVTIADDEVDEDAETFEVTLSSAQNAALAGGQTTLAVTGTITDDDQRGVTVNPTSLTVEEGSSKPYTVVLRSQPTEEVTVSASVPSNTDVSASPTSLTFTADDWSTARTVTVSVAEDDDADVDAAVTITHAVSGGDYGDNNATASNVSVTSTETDTPTRALALAKTTEAVNFTGVGTGIGYSYEAENSGNVTLTGTLAVADDKIRASKISCAAVPAGGLVPGASLTCTGSYTVTQADVDVAEVTNTAIATLDGVVSNEATETVPWAQSQQQKPVLSVPAVVNPPNAVIGQESGGALAFLVSLSRTSAQTVTVSFETSDGTATAGDDYTATDGTLTFAPGTTERTISVTIANDDLDEADESFKVRLSQVVNATLPGGTATLEVTGTIADDDERGVTVSPTSLTVAEGGDKPYTVALATRPTGQVTVAIGGTTGTDLMVDKSSLTFTASGWRTVQTVTVTAGEDDDGSNDSETLAHTASGADYGSVTRNLPVTVTDNDSAGIVLTPTALEVTEGGSATYTVELATEPSGQVTVTVGGATGTDLTVVNGSLTFTASTWNTAQTVEVRAGEDDDGTQRQRDLDAHGLGRRLRFGDQEPAGDGDRRRHRRHRADPDHAPSDRRRQRNLHGEAGDGARRPGDGDGRRSRRH